MARYNSTKISSKNKKNYYNTTIYKKVPERDTDRYFILANEFYGNPNLWWFIARVNNLTTMNIPAGTSLRIPIDTEFAKGL